MTSDLDPEFSPNLRNFFSIWGPKGKEGPRVPKESPRAAKGIQKGGKEHQQDTKSKTKLYETN